MERSLSLEGIGAEILEILYGYVKVESITNSPGEREAEDYFLSFFRAQPYWRAHPDQVGTWPVPGDPFGRSAVFAAVRGGGGDTVAFVHHSDVVTVEDFQLLRPLAFDPEGLERALWDRRQTLSREAREDLESGDWIFGRGVCDMKGGGAVQMALLRRYAALAAEDPGALPGTLVLLAVPDEENLSAGMRAAVGLLADLKERWGLTYRLMVNSEPHQRRDPARGVFSTGSVGKLLPFFYVRGSLAHAGKVFEGFNPVQVLTEIVRRTELNMDLSDTAEGEAAPPPTWLHLRDRKIQYDVSMPLSAAGCLSVLTLDQTPESLLRRIRDICEESFAAVLSRMNESYRRFLAAVGRRGEPLPWRVRVSDFAQLYAEAEESGGEAFRAAYAAEADRLLKELRGGRTTLVECNFALVDFVYDYVEDLSPRVVFGLVPPYYPNVSNRCFPALSPAVRDLPGVLTRFVREEFGQEYDTEHYFTGISDLSYTSITGGGAVLQALERAMPLFGLCYDIPVAGMEAISMPCINIGPWGKDFHKLTERVLREDLCQRTPRILRRAVEAVL